MSPMKKILPALLFIVALIAGCATTIMEGYVGKPITEVVLDYGPPVNFLDIEQGRRAFQWRIDSSGYIPMTTPSNGSIYGAGGYASYTSTTTTYVPYEQSCLYTMTATWSGETWVVDGFRQPRLGCM